MQKGAKEVVWYGIDGLITLQQKRGLEGGKEGLFTQAFMEYSRRESR